MSKKSLITFSVSCLVLILPLTSLIAASDQIQKGEMAGYLLVPNDRVDNSYDAGFSIYVTAWPLLEQYPGNRFQTGLFGTWMHAHYDKKPTERLYSDVEGGLGWWRDTRFATETPKFIMGGVALNFSEWANGPGAGKGRSWEQPRTRCNGPTSCAVLEADGCVFRWPPTTMNPIGFFE